MQRLAVAPGVSAPSAAAASPRRVGTASSIRRRRRLERANLLPARLPGRRPATVFRARGDGEEEDDDGFGYNEEDDGFGWNDDGSGGFFGDGLDEEGEPPVEPVVEKKKKKKSKKKKPKEVVDEEEADDSASLEDELSSSRAAEAEEEAAALEAEAALGGRGASFFDEGDADASFFDGGGADAEASTSYSSPSKDEPKKSKKKKKKKSKAVAEEEGDLLFDESGGDEATSSTLFAAEDAASFADEDFGDDGLEDELGDFDATDLALAEASEALRDFLRGGRSAPPDPKKKKRGKRSKRESSRYELSADLAAEARDAVASLGDGADTRPSRDPFKESLEKGAAPPLPPPRRWLRRVADMGPTDAARWCLSEVKRRMDHEQAIPPIGGAYISYARLLELLSYKRVTRLTVLASGRCALVETPVIGFSVDYNTAAYDPIEPGILRGQALPLGTTEVTRFWCDLPGDVWEQGTMMRLAKDAATPVVQEGGIIDAQDQPVLSASPGCELVVRPPENAFLFLDQVKGSAMPILGLIALRTLTVLYSKVRRLFGKGPKDEEVAELVGELGRTNAIQFNVDAEGGKSKDTGVRYSDVAGVDGILSEIKEIVAMLLKTDPRYEAIGANPPRGIIFAGPPGTGKTLLARAMAGEAGVPFFAASGSEFVEMYQGVASARIRDLFKLARKVAPSIIFIDEIDAIARARSLNSGNDPGSAEREAGLMQLLVEMDGFVRDDRVLVIGATNLVEAMDAAALRPGRFGKIVRLDPPRVDSRWRILRVHATGKPLDRSGDDVVEAATGERKDALLWRAALKTKGWSGAELANLMNEAAILMVRHDKDEIDWEVMSEALEKRDLTAAPTAPPGGEAGRRLAVIHAARAVASALTPGFPRVDGVGIDGRGSMVARIKFDAVDYFRSGDGSVRLLFGPRPRVAVAAASDEARERGQGDEEAAEDERNSRRLPTGVTSLPASDEALDEVLSYRGRGPSSSSTPRPSPDSSASFAPPTAYEAACGLLVPLLTARAAEAIYFGASEGTTLASAREVAAAGDYAFWLATSSNMHPARARSSPSARFQPTELGPDNLTRGARSQGESDAVELQRRAYGRAKRVLRRWRPAVDALADALVESADGTLEGEQVASILASNVPPPPGARLPGNAAVGGVRYFRALGAGRPGIAVFGSAAASREFGGCGEGPAAALEEWASAGVDLVNDAAAVAAVEAVAGALSGQDLTASGLSAEAKRKLAAAIRGGGEADEVKRRLAAVRRYSTSPGRGEDEPPFPPPPVGDDYVPVDAGPSLVNWVPELGGPPFSRMKGAGFLGSPRR